MSDLPPGFRFYDPNAGLPPGFSFQDPNAGPPPPAPGTIIEDPNRTYVQGAPPGPPMVKYSEGQPVPYHPAMSPPSVDTTGMSPEQRAQARQAIEMRRDAPFSLRPVLPFYQGVTSSWGDEPVSALYAAKEKLLGRRPFGEAYDLGQEYQRQELAQERAENPGRSTALQVGGGVAQFPLTRALPVAGATSLGGRMLQSGAVGAGYGAVEGAGAGSGFWDRLKQGGINAAIGSVVGGAAPVAERFYSALTNRALDSATVNRQLADINLGRPAGNVLFRAGAADDAFRPGGAGQTNIQEAGPHAMVADTGPTMRGVMDETAQAGGPGTRIIQDAVEDRTRLARQDLTQALDDTMGPSVGVARQSQAVRDATEAARRATYDAAHYNPDGTPRLVDYSTQAGAEIRRGLEGVPAKAIEAANTQMRSDLGRRAVPIEYGVDEKGFVTFKTPPNVQQLDYLTRGIKDLTTTEAGALGGKTGQTAGYDRMVGQIRTPLRQAAPEYGTALDTAADAISQNRALEFGQSLLKGSVDRDVARDTVANMSPAELGHARSAVRRQIDNTMANVKRIASDSNQDGRAVRAAVADLDSEQGREKIRLIMDPADADKLFKKVDEAVSALGLQADMRTNSRTAGRAAVKETKEALAAPGFWGSLIGFKPKQALNRAGEILTGNTPQDVVRRTDLTNEQIASFGTEARGPDALARLLALSNAYNVGVANQEAAKTIGKYGGAGTGLAGYQLAPSLLSFFGIPTGR